MNLVATFLNTFVVVAVGAVLTYVTTDRFKALRREMDGFRGDLADLQTGLKADIARVESRLDAGVAAVRSDIVQVALAVGAGRGAAQG